MQLNKTTVLVLLFLSAAYATSAHSIDCLYKLQNAQTDIFDTQTKALERDVNGVFAAFKNLQNAAQILKDSCPNVALILNTESKHLPKYNCRDSLDHVVSIVEELSGGATVPETIQRLIDFSRHFKEVCANEDTSNYIYDTLEDSDDDGGQNPQFGKWNDSDNDDSNNDNEVSDDSDSEDKDDIESEEMIAAQKGAKVQDEDEDEDEDSDDVPPNFAAWNGSVEDSDNSSEDSEDDGDEDSDEDIPAITLPVSNPAKENLKGKDITKANN